ncbi:pyridoxamine 5'-phosphate oxidase [Microbulbifer echini]|uniref:Pyridoxine/pyridoxamine 5'-phosphate oxidase n=1 Tax=Microbulbifer echini TaxID=1529067 RepID=A0ABV4NKR3_9GAMM|nr:pyridoxamine 5'-phosphate oxidase [uncultured Microbulbifer sp.]
MEIDQWRRDYVLGSLHRSELKPTPAKQFSQWLEEILAAGLDDPTAMSLATVGTSGQPSQRIVQLKGFDESGFVFYTNLHSKKARDMEVNPQVSLLFPWHPLERQVIVYGKVQPVAREDAVTYFQSRPLNSQLAAWASRQSQPVSSREELQKQFDLERSRFAGGEVPLPDFWGGYRVMPHAVEFWQGGAYRLHDRFMYQIDDGGLWTVERLSP